MGSWHAKLPASAAHRWMNCPGSIAMAERVPPSPPSRYTNKGTAAAYLAEKCLKAKPRSKFGKPETYIGQWIFLGSNGMPMILDFEPEIGSEIDTFEVDADIAEYVSVYVDFIRSLKRDLLIEQRFELIKYYTGGTPDTIAYENWGPLTICDLKFGRGVIVEPEENHQMSVYLLGYYHEWPEHVHTSVEFVIVQPRADHPKGPIRRWTVPRGYLSDFARRMKMKAKEAKRPNAELKAGSWCRFCAASGRCPAQLEQSRELARLDFEPIPTNKELEHPALLSDNRLAEIYDYKDFIETWFKDIGKEISSRINRGHKVPGYKLVEGVGHRKFQDEADAEKRLRRRGFKKSDLYAAPKLKSPAQIEKLKGGRFKTAKERSAFVSSLTVRPKTEPKLVREADPRAGMLPAHAEFEDLTQTD